VSGVFPVDRPAKRGRAELGDHRPRRETKPWPRRTPGGNANHKRRVAFGGPQDAARAKWRQLHLDPGSFDLIDPGRPRRGALVGATSPDTVGVTEPRGVCSATSVDARAPWTPRYSVPRRSFDPRCCVLLGDAVSAGQGFGKTGCHPVSLAVLATLNVGSTHRPLLCGSCFDTSLETLCMSIIV
jgi:hypothetical protein